MFFSQNAPQRFRTYDTYAQKIENQAKIIGNRYGWPEAVSQSNQEAYQAVSTRQEHPISPGTKLNGNWAKIFDLELFLLPKNHFPELEKNFDFIFENFAEFYAKTIFFIVFRWELMKIQQIDKVGGTVSFPPHFLRLAAWRFKGGY